MPCLVAVDKDVSGNTFDLALSYLQVLEVAEQVC